MYSSALLRAQRVRCCLQMSRASSYVTFLCFATPVPDAFERELNRFMQIVCHDPVTVVATKLFEDYLLHRAQLAVIPFELNKNECVIQNESSVRESVRPVDA